MTSNPDFKVTTFFEVDCRKKWRVLKTKLLLHRRKLYLTYGMLLFVDVDWSLNVSCRFVSISWASCIILQYCTYYWSVLGDCCTFRPGPPKIAGARFVTGQIPFVIQTTVSQHWRRTILLIVQCMSSSSASSSVERCRPCLHKSPPCAVVHCQWLWSRHI